MAVKLSYYDRSVFINCPFDKSYKPIFWAIVFAVYDCGFIPRSALEATDEPQRLDRILGIIGESRLSIHDLSRAGIDRNSGYARFNMPFELGLFLGVAKYGKKEHANKNYAIFDKDRYRYQKFITDLNGHDPHPHGLKAEQAVANVRNFLRNQNYVDFGMPGPTEIHQRYLTFRKKLPSLAKACKMKHTDLIFKDYCYLVQEWLNAMAP